MKQSISSTHGQNLLQLPTYSISVNGNKLKLYPDNKVYLKSGTNFELFFENMTRFNYKAQISFNGVDEPSSLVLKPGQRYRLDRFMDVDKKLLFDTYQVDNSPEVQAAIVNNGWVSVSFFKEKTFTPIVNYFWSPNNITFDAFNTHTVNYSTTSNGRSFSKSISDSELPSVQCSVAMDMFETGRVEKGEQSSQKFKNVNMEFEYYSDCTIQYQILPEAYRPIETLKPSQIRNYCPNCGMRIKQGWNGCPKCVIKF